MSERLSKPKSDNLNPSTDENKSPRIQSNPSSVHPCQQSSSHLEAQEPTCKGDPPTEAQVTSSPREDTPVITSTTSTGTVAASGDITTTTSTLTGDVITTAASTGRGDVVNVSTAAAASGKTATAATKAISVFSSNPKDTLTSSLTITISNTTTTTTTTTTSTTPIASATRAAKLQKAGPSRQQRRGVRRAVTDPSSSSASAMVVNVPCDPPGELSLPSTAGGNGHVLPQGTGENRDVPRNPSPLPTSSSVSTISHGERQIGVPPPAPRKADAQRNSECIASFNQRLTKEGVKRKLFDVDHEKVEKDISKELNKIVESDRKRFREKYELLRREVNSNAPAFYHTTEITSNRKRVAVSSSTTTTIASSSSSVGALVTSALTTNTRDVALASSSSAKSENGAHGGSSSSGASAEVTGGEIDSGAGARNGTSSVAPPEEVRVIRSTNESPLPLSSPVRRTSQRLLLTSRKNPNTPLGSPSSSSSSPFTSPSSSSSLFSSPVSSSLSSSLNLSTSSMSSSSGVSSLESTPTQERQSSQQSVTPAGTNTPVGSVDTPTQGGGTPPMVGRTTPTQETSASIQRPSTASNIRKKRSTQSPPSDSSRRRKPPRI